MCAVSSLVSSRLSIRVLELNVRRVLSLCVTFSVGTQFGIHVQRTRQEAILFLEYLVDQFFLASDNFFINFSTSTIKSLNLNCSNNVLPFSEKSTWKSNQDALDDYKEHCLNAIPLNCCVEFAVCQFRQTCITAR